ncbi:MAG: PAS domain S-box protein, partial [Burkholderiales bacterium]
MRAWWLRLSPARQDRVATVAPLLSVLLFLAAIIAAFWYLRNEEIEREVESVRRDTEMVQQQIRLRLIDNQEQLLRMARTLGPPGGAAGTERFAAQADALTRSHPEISSLTWLGGQQQVVARYVSPDQVSTLPRVMDSPDANESEFRREIAVTYTDARVLRMPVYSRPFRLGDGPAVFLLQIPLSDRGFFVGTLAATYTMETLLRYFVPTEVAKRHVMTLTDRDGKVLASTLSSPPGQSQPALTYSAPFMQMGHGIQLRGEGYRTSISLIGNTLFWMVVALSVLTVWMLLGTWRHMHRRLQIQGALIQETNFRRAMENSMLTGMRAMDMDGRISYVNPAFCAMTGFSESELIGRLPPFPHWPRDRVEESTRLLQQELSGRSPPGGIEVKVLRKDGSQFDARNYVSPLIDARGQQTGWMTSMTNITEAKRVRDQLSASHERFTTVLEGLDAAVSVVAAQSGELLFANRSYRLWFGGDARRHVELAGGAAPMPPDPDEAVDGMGGLPTSALTGAGADS